MEVPFSRVLSFIYAQVLVGAFSLVALKPFQHDGVMLSAHGQWRRAKGSLLIPSCWLELDSLEVNKFCSGEQILFTYGLQSHGTPFVLCRETQTRNSLRNGVSLPLRKRLAFSVPLSLATFIFSL